MRLTQYDLTTSLVKELHRNLIQNRSNLFKPNV